MNIDIEKLRKAAMSGDYSYKEIIDEIEQFKIKPVDCNECSEPKEANKTMTNCAYCVNNPHFENNFKPKPKEWYEDESNFPCLCWCNSLIKLIKSSYVFNGDRCFTSDTIIAFDNATPLTKEEVLKYCAGEK